MVEMDQRIYAEELGKLLTDGRMARWYRAVVFGYASSKRLMLTRKGALPFQSCHIRRATGSAYIIAARLMKAEIRMHNRT